MKKLIMTVFMVAFCFSISASENPLIGKWSKSSDRGLMVVSFGTAQMTMASSLDLTKDAQSVKVKYKQLDKSWDIELLADDGSVQGAMLATFESEDRIKFGAPGSAFFVLNRVK